jgi:hypothetical protein
MAWEINNFHAVCNVLSSVEYGDELYFELFTPRPGVRTNQPDAMYVIGAIKCIADRNNCKAYGYTPATNKATITNADLKALAWYNTGLQHANDAARILATAGLFGECQAVQDYVRETLRDLSGV